MELSIPSTNMACRKCQYFLETRTHKPPKFPQGLDKPENQLYCFRHPGWNQGPVHKIAEVPNQATAMIAHPSELAGLQASQLAGCQGILVSPHSLPACYKTLGPACQLRVVIFLSVWAQAWEEQEVCPESLMKVVSVSGLNSWEGIQGDPSVIQYN